jgi:tRNA(fMet)-specific endonuclease VapC
VLPLDLEDARHAGELRARLAARGTPIGAYDILIAGQARARGLVLITRNLREFERAPGLNAENWHDPPRA